MKRFSVGILVLLLATGLSTASAEGAKKKGGAAKGKKAAAAAPNSAQIAESLGDVHWGMSKDELMQKLIDKVKEKYRPLLGKTKDAVKEDQLRQKAREEMEAIRKGYYEFNLRFNEEKNKKAGGEAQAFAKLSDEIGRASCRERV